TCARPTTLILFSRAYIKNENAAHGYVLTENGRLSGSATVFEFANHERRGEDHLSGSRKTRRAVLLLAPHPEILRDIYANDLFSLSVLVLRSLQDCRDLRLSKAFWQTWRRRSRRCNKAPIVASRRESFRFSASRTRRERFIAKLAETRFIATNP